MKTIHISDTKTLKEIKSEFNAHFPHLKIEFYSTDHEEGEGSMKTAMYDEALTLNSIRKTDTEGDLSINGHQKTSTFEENFFTHFGVSVQVFRKSGKIWLQTTATDEWTLSEQEHKGEEFDRN